MESPCGPARTAATVMSPVCPKEKPCEAVIVPVPVMAGEAPEVVTSEWFRLTAAPRARVAPAPRVSGPPLPRALVALAVTVPADSTAPPVKVAATLSVRLPRPSLVNAPTPEPREPARATSTPLVSSVPPPARKLSARPLRSSAKPAPRRSAPPAKTSAPVAPPI